jgi:hypothetical protein
VITHRFIEKRLFAPIASLDETVDALFTLLSFETFDTLAGPTRSLEEVAPQVCRLVHAALNLNTK